MKKIPSEVHLKRLLFENVQSEVHQNRQFPRIWSESYIKTATFGDALFLKGLKKGRPFEKGHFGSYAVAPPIFISADPSISPYCI